MVDAAGIFDMFTEVEKEKEIIKSKKAGEGRNEILMFLKPECFFVDRGHFISIMQMIEEKLEDYHAKINGAVILKGGRLKELRIIDRHYGYINLMSREASKHRDDIESPAREALGIDADKEIEILGGNEFLEKHKQFDSTTLNEFWETKKSARLRSGLYCQIYEVEGDSVVIVNGFHPSQLDYFTESDRGIVIFILQTDTDWSKMKNEFAGNTFPEKALPDSVRGIIYNNKEEYGVDSISVSRNFMHLSAGPFEAAFEIMNFFGRLDVVKYSAENTELFKEMKKKGLSISDYERAISNPQVTAGDSQHDLFSDTEEKNTSEAIAVYIDMFRE